MGQPGLHAPLSLSPLDDILIANHGLSDAGQIPKKDPMTEYNVHLENGLIAMFPPEVYRRLQPKFLVQSFKLEEIILESEGIIDTLFFPAASTLASVVAITQGGTSVEIGMIASEGMVGASACLGASRSVHHVLIQAPGNAMVIKASEFLQEFEQEPALRKIVLAYTHRFSTSVSQTALCNRLHSLTQRLSRWLLMTEDKVKTTTLPLTQEFLSKMLGANRASVSEGCTALQKAGIISYKRGEVIVENRAALEATACECYAFLIEHFKRTI